MHNLGQSNDEPGVLSAVLDNARHVWIDLAFLYISSFINNLNTIFRPIISSVIKIVSVNGTYGIYAENSTHWIVGI